MRRTIAVFVWLAAVGGSRAAGAGPLDRDPGAEARGVFAARCAGCHGPDLAKPLGRFGYVLDLRRVAGNPELVIPGRPDESELWALVRHGDMPPPGAPSGPLTEVEKTAIRTWIAAGAPAPVTDVPGSGTPPDTNSTAASPAARTVRWAGKFHLLLLHFPIALVLTAVLVEVASAWRGDRVPSPVVGRCLTLAAVAVVPTVVFGWLFAAAGSGAGAPRLLSAHRWLGTATGVWVVGTALAAGRDARRGARSRGARIMVAVGALLVVATAHVGGLTAHGLDFFDW